MLYVGGIYFVFVIAATTYLSDSIHFTQFFIWFHLLVDFNFTRKMGEVTGLSSSEVAELCRPADAATKVYKYM